ncbi:MAG: triose-phosphate isomerase [Candidatus Dependentiae bacterium]|nr:triose-phosphate isomerase [Candidatus Dependentiae bacterium]
MKKQLLYVANWKMNMLVDQAVDFTVACKEFVEQNKDLAGAIAICPTFLHIAPVVEILEDSPIGVGAQNCSEHESGAYTGDVSALALSDIFCDYCIVGHSERRTHHNESNEVVARKVAQLLANMIFPIICIGETAEEHDLQQTQEILESQLLPIIEVLNNAEQLPGVLTIAYEPVWAIGTGKTPDSASLEKTFKWLTNYLQTQVNEKIEFCLLYGGSVDEKTAPQLAQVKGLGGFLIGNASLDFQKFKNIVGLTH